MQTRFAYVGSYTAPERQGRGNGINVYSVDGRTGAFRHVQRISQLENPSFLALSQGYIISGQSGCGGTAPCCFGET